MKQGKLYFDGTTDRFNFSYRDADGDQRNDGGIHCGECFEVCLNGVWVPTRMEMDISRRWYLVGLPGLELEGLEVRQR